MDAQNYLIKKYNGSIAYKLYKIVESCETLNHIDTIKKWVELNDLNYWLNIDGEKEYSVRELLYIKRQKIRKNV